MATWTNNDGLKIRYGADESRVGVAGEYNRGGPLHHVEVEIDLVSLGTNPTVLSDKVTIPIGARIESVELISEVAGTSGGSAVLNLGLYRTDGTTAIDADGLVAAFAVASINAAGEKTVITPGGTGAGALLGTTLTNPGVLVADYDTAAFTAGRVIARVFWYVP